MAHLDPADVPAEDGALDPGVGSHRNDFALRHLLPLGGETRWSDLLAVLVEMDPRPLAELLGVTDLTSAVVSREVVLASARNGDGDGADSGRRGRSGTPGDRVDLVVDGNGVSVLIEVKVQSGLGRQQLQRYQAASPSNDAYVVVFPRFLRIAEPEGWTGITWEDLLDRYGASDDPWVASVARQWRDYVDAWIPKVDEATLWNRIPEDERLLDALRARMSWLFGAFSADPDLDPSIAWEVGAAASGASPLVKASLPVADPDMVKYSVVVEVQEGIQPQMLRRAQDSGNPAGQLKGPQIRFALAQTDVPDAQSFDWEYLHSRLWPAMQELDSDIGAAGGRWKVHPSGPQDQHAKEGYQQMLARGGPRELGYGFNMTGRHRSILMGGVAQLSADVTLAEVAAVVAHAVRLMPGVARQT